MIIHQHPCPRSPMKQSFIYPPAFYAYDSLQAETCTGDYNVPYWVSAVDGLQLGFQWTIEQSIALKQYPVYKVYDLITHNASSICIVVTRVGYLLPTGFLPIWLTYRSDIDIHRCVMPRNVGYLYNYLLQLTKPVCVGMAPAIQFILDIAPTSPLDGQAQFNYLTAQRLSRQALLEGAILADDIRSTVSAADKIRYLSAGFDGLGSVNALDDDEAYAWFISRIMCYPPVRDWLLDTWRYGPIPLETLYQLTGPGVIDKSPALVLTYPLTAEKLPDVMIEKILWLHSTDLVLTFAIINNQIQSVPTYCFAQNRFAAYIQTPLTSDVETVLHIVQKLWLNGLYAYGPAATMPATQVTFELTSNEEVKISFGDREVPDRHRVYYADLVNALDMGCSVAQSPYFTQKY